MSSDIGRIYGFDKVLDYVIVASDIYGANWTEHLTELLDSHPNFYIHDFHPPCKGQRYVSADKPFMMEVAKEDFPSSSPRIIIGKSHNNTPNNPPGKWNKQPRIGSIVRYVMCDRVVKPAIVLEVSPTIFVGSNKDLVYLQVFDEPNRYEWARFSPDSPNTWHWPSDE